MTTLYNTATIITTPSKPQNAIVGVAYLLILNSVSSLADEAENGFLTDTKIKHYIQLDNTPVFYNEDCENVVNDFNALELVQAWVGAHGMACLCVDKPSSSSELINKMVILLALSAIDFLAEEQELADEQESLDGFLVESLIRKVNDEKAFCELLNDIWEKWID